MVQNQLPEDFLSPRGQQHQHLAAVLSCTLATHEPAGFEAIDQFDRAVVLNLKLLGQFPDTWPQAWWETLQGEQQLVLARLQV